MTERAPRVTAKEVMRFLESRGFYLSRTVGSHHVYKDQSNQRTVVPLHSGKILGPKLLASILRDGNLSVADFKEYLRR